MHNELASLFLDIPIEPSQLPVADLSLRVFRVLPLLVLNVGQFAESSLHAWLPVEVLGQPQGEQLSFGHPIKINITLSYLVCIID